MSDIYKFEHKGKTYEIPSFAALPVGVIRKTRHAEDEADKVFQILEEVAGADSKVLAAIDSMTMAQFEVFISGWTQGAPVGESVSSES